MSTIEEIYEKVILTDLEDEDRARLAGMILGSVNPRNENLRAFWEQLGSVGDELEARLEEWHENETMPGE